MKSKKIINQNMSKVTRSVILGLSIIVIAVVLALLIAKFNILSVFVPSPKYAAVYLTTGEVYYGRMSMFGGFKLSNVVTLQKDKDGNISVQKLNDAIWKPKNPVSFQKDHIVFWSYLDSTSPLIDVIENKTQAAANQPTTDTTVTPAPSKK
ncbi:MAG: Uncharacterized protein Athens071426_14 [Parcubacteria group bacterium Athens0714_26]|nr:MAG: Uncharacterized protein Athens101426_228 [Parcubacteria group bacterium Athens1014_26]TSD03807.1 MAG: Uncharacterized protein Athens071426_14 [Parcubacteria group bacterium Athens0714_26]